MTTGRATEGAGRLYKLPKNAVLVEILDFYSIIYVYSRIIPNTYTFICSAPLKCTFLHSEPACPRLYARCIERKLSRPRRRRLSEANFTRRRTAKHLANALYVVLDLAPSSAPSCIVACASSIHPLVRECTREHRTRARE